MKIIDSKEALLNWNDYREYLKIELKKLDGPGQFFVSKDKLEFDIDGTKWKGHAVLTGPKAIMSIRKLKGQGLIFREGSVERQGKNLAVADMIPKLEKEAKKTFLKLKLGYKVLGAEGEDETGENEAAEAVEEMAGSDTTTDTAAIENELKQIKKELTGDIRSAVDGNAQNKAKIADLVRKASQAEKSGDFGGAVERFNEIRGELQQGGDDLVNQAKKIETAVKVWNKTEEAATKELRKLQKAILDLGDPRGRPVIQGLEGILTKLDKVDDEAREAADAAAKGDHQGFQKARDDFMNKMNRILDYVNKDELIKDADNNPAVNIKIAETITNSLNRLMKAV